jgi:hypothetical protein
MACAEVARICSRGTAKALWRNQPGSLHTSLQKVDRSPGSAPFPVSWTRRFKALTVAYYRQIGKKRGMLGSTKSLHGDLPGLSSSLSTTPVKMATTEGSPPHSILDQDSSPPTFSPSSSITKTMSNMSFGSELERQPPPDSPTVSNTSEADSSEDAPLCSSSSLQWQPPDPNPKMYTGASF